jgi:hypothetical protein
MGDFVLELNIFVCSLRLTQNTALKQKEHEYDGEELSFQKLIIDTNI